MLSLTVMIHLTLFTHHSHNIHTALDFHVCLFKVQYSRGEQYAQQVDALFCETSALNSTNVEELFIEICEF